MLPSTGIVTAAVLCCWCLVATPTEAKAGRPYSFRPLYMQKGSSARSRSGSISALAPEAGTGRGLVKHFLKFRSIFQQPQSNVIIITQTTAPTTTTASPTTTTTTTTRMGRVRDSVPTVTYVGGAKETQNSGLASIYASNDGIDGKVNVAALGGGGGGGGGLRRDGGGSGATVIRRRTNNSNRRRNNFRHQSNFNNKNNNNNNNINQARIRKIIKNANRNGNQNNINNNNNNDSDSDSDNWNLGNPEIQNIVNAFRRQGAVVYNR